MPESDHRSPSRRPTLEDLLHLKRAERPSPEFWSRFEHELRQKQLAALMERRPWWHTFTRQILRNHAIMPLGAAAVLSVVYLSNHTWQPVPANAVPSAIEAGHLPVAGTPVDTSLNHVSAQPPSVTPAEAQSVPVLVAASDAPSRQELVVLSPQLPERAMETIPWVAASSSQGLPAHLMMLEVGADANSTPGFAAIPVATAFAQAAISIPGKSAENNGELTSVSQQSSRRGRLLAQFSERQFSREPQAPAHMRERLARRLADANIPDQITRIGLKGDQVSLRF